MLYEEIFTVIVRVQSGRYQIQNAEAFRRKVIRALKEAGRAATKSSFHDEDVEKANFAVVAFLDEAVLNSNDPERDQWARKTLQEELFGKREAGEVFFGNLEQLRANRDSPHLGQVLEIYYLCLLLGYEGRYAAGSKTELHLLMDSLRERIERLSRADPYFSPDARLPIQDAPRPSVEPLSERLRVFALASAAFAVFWFIVLTLHLHSITRAIIQELLQ